MRRRGLVLMVVLAIVALLALLGTTFAYRVRADLSAVTAQSNSFQAELAAEAGVERAKLLLRKARLPLGVEREERDRWDDNPEALRRIIVYTPGRVGGQTQLDQNVEEGKPGWRFSVIAPPIDEGQRGTEPTKFRYGVVDEAGKLNLNTATREQLIALFNACHVEQLQEKVVASDLAEQLADCLLDWREPGETPRPKGAKTSYYQTLTPRYRCKGAPLESVEEVLLIKGFNGRILYGEDFNRNGHLDPNEDDGDEGLFPPDNADNKLNRGIYPFVTVYSRDDDTANDNKPRIPVMSLNLDTLPQQYREILEQEIRPEIFEFIKTARSKGVQFQSLGELLLPLRIPKKPPAPQGGQAGPGRSGQPRPGGGQADSGAPRRGGRGGSGDAEGADRPQGRGGQRRQPDGGGERGSDRTGGRGAGRDRQPGGRGGDGGEMRGGQRVPRVEDLTGEGGDDKIGRRQQEIRGGQRVPTVEDLTGGRNPDDIGDQPMDRPADRGEPGRGRGPRGPGRDPQTPPDFPRGENEPPSDQKEEPQAPGDMPPPSEEDEGPETQPSDAEDEEAVEEIPTPVEPSDMPFILDRLTTGKIRQGLINVNTASREVLMTLPGLTEQDVDTILATRLTLDEESKKTPAWLVIRDAVSREKFAKILPYVTARSQEFTVESIGFADHEKVFKRLQVVIRMVRQVDQVLYWRDISSLGPGYPLWEDEWQYGTSGGN